VVGTVTTGGNVEGTVTAQHNSSDSVCCFVTAVKGRAGDRIYRRKERERGGYSNGGRQCGSHSDSTTQQQSHSACCFVTAVKGTAGGRIY
jgi:hypothetical protein